MNLEQKWAWNKRILPCKLRIETGNPGADELRERICELLNKDYASFQRYWLYDSKTAADKATNAKEEKNKNATSPPRDEDEEVQAALRRINVSLGLFSRSDAVRPTKLDAPKAGGTPAVKGMPGYKDEDDDHGMPMHRRNLNKKFIEVPKSPPRRALYDLKMERLNMAVKTVTRPQTYHDAMSHAALESLESTGGDLGLDGSLLDDKKRRMMRMGPNFVDPLMPLEGGPPSAKHQPSDAKRIFKPYNGDIFGTDARNEGGMIYLSRMAPKVKTRRTIVVHNSSGAKDADQHTVSTDSSEPGGTSTSEQFPETLADDRSLPGLNTSIGPSMGAPSSPGGNALGGNASMAPTPSMRETQAKLHCAMTLCNWTSYEANTERLAKEGAVQAIMRLSKEADRNIRRYCAMAFRQMSTRPPLAKQMVSLGAVSVISDLANNAGKNKAVVVHCTVALVNLTRHVGCEAKLVEDMIVMALMPLLNDTEEWDELCARGLFNLTCVDQSYPLMERVIKAFVQLASSSVVTSVKYICASALCNIADLKPMRMRMVEEGVVQVST
jgi:hypothetical protein